MNHIIAVSVNNAFFSYGHDDLSGMGFQNFITVHSFKHQRCFMFVRSQVCNFFNPFFRDIHIRCRIQHDRNPFFIAPVNDISNGIHANLMLEHDKRRCLDDVESRINYIFIYFIISTLQYDNAVIAFCQNDVRRAGRFIIQDRHIIRIHAVFFERIEHHAAISVIANTANHIYLFPKSGCCYCLIGPFSSRRNDQSLSHNCFAGLWSSVGLDHEIHVTAAYHRNMTHITSLICIYLM